MSRTIFTFDTTHHALWAEEIARDERIAYEVVPAPAAANARCDIAIETLPEGRSLLAGALEKADVPHRIHGEA